MPIGFQLEVGSIKTWSPSQYRENHKENDANHEQDLRNLRCCTSNSGKAENCRYDGDDQKRNGPRKHIGHLVLHEWLVNHVSRDERRCSACSHYSDPNERTEFRN